VTPIRTRPRTIFSILKRGIDGAYRHVSEAHLPRYLAEFDAADIWTVPVRMEYARVRLTSPPNVIRGFYIGATSDAVYLAPNHTSHVGREVLALPQSRVVKVRVFTSSEAWPKGGGPDKCKSPP
jgi:hypothetical protein